MDDRIRALQTYPMLELAKRRRALEAQGVNVLDFGTGDPVEATAPEIREALCDAVPAVSQYPSVAGTPELRAAFTEWFAWRFQVKLDPDTEVLPSRGSKEAIFHLPLVFLESGREELVIHPEPGYPVMEIGTLYAGGVPRPYPLNAENEYRMRPDAIPEEELARARIVWLNYPHNPTGQDLPRELFEAWVAARDKHGFILCSDECYTEIYFGERPSTLLQFGREGCLVFHSLSKRSGMTGYRAGIVAGDPDLLALYRAQRAGFGQANPAFIEAAAARAWADEVHVAKRRATFGKKREIMRTGLGKLGLKVYPTTSTFYLWVEVPAGETGTSYAQQLLRRGVIVSPGAFFGPGNDQFIRLALVPTVLGCQDALRRWARI